MPESFWQLLPNVVGGAQFVEGCHRLWLTRDWGDAPEFVLHIGMNPSYAGADRDDLTVRKDQEFTKRMGLCRMVKCNVGSYISTDPKGLLERGVVVCHRDNHDTILHYARRAARIVVATGRPPDPLVPHARTLFRSLKAAGLKLECFGLTRDHWPKHSSRLGYDTPLVEFVW